MSTLPVFALDAASPWADLENAMAGSAEYQASRRGRILPLLLFAPMTEPENPDAWEPMKALPENLLIISIERPMDNRILRALQQAAAVCGETQHAAACPLVRIDFELPLANVYEQMAGAGILSYALTHPGKDDSSFFLLRGSAAVRAFATELPKVAR